MIIIHGSYHDELSSTTVGAKLIDRPYYDNHSNGFRSMSSRIRSWIHYIQSIFFIAPILCTLKPVVSTVKHYIDILLPAVWARLIVRCISVGVFMVADIKLVLVIGHLKLTGLLHSRYLSTRIWGATKKKQFQFLM